MNKTLLRISLCCTIGAAVAMLGALAVGDEVPEVEPQDVIDESAE